VNNYYRLYIEDILNLASTIVIKFDDIAKAINLKVMVDFGINSVTQDKATWKYYQNIAGKYHFSDKMIKVVSLDTTEEIDFTPENLNKHPFTKKAYLYGKRHYRQLIQQYPDKESLILGIVYPSDMQKAIDSIDGTILTYPTYLIESNEYSLIFNLQNWIYAYVDRWINKQYCIAHDLYSSMYLAQLTINLVPIIINLRLQACKTNEAHSYHIRQYLASHCMLDKYIDVMTKQQALYFYRNIKYILRNSGKRDTFNLLLQNIMTDRGLPMYEYNMHHDLSFMPGYLDKDSNYVYEYEPRVLFKRGALNSSILQRHSSDYSIDEINTKIIPLAPDNEDAVSSDKYSQTKKLVFSNNSKLGTKLLESSLMDYTDCVPYPLETIVYNQWMYYASIDIYKAQITLHFPKDKSTIDTNVKNSAILFLYCMYKAVGITLDRLPTFLAEHVYLYQETPRNKLDKFIIKGHVTKEQIDELYSYIPNVEPMNSLSSFYENCLKIFDYTIIQNIILCTQERHTNRQILYQAKTALFGDVLCDYNKNPIYYHYDKFLNDNGIKLNDYSQDDYYNLALSILSENINLSENPKTNFKLLQKMMIELFRTLSSYSIEIASDITQPPISLVERLSIRIDREKFIQKSLDFCDIAKFKLFDDIAKEKTYLKYDLDKVYPLYEDYTKEKTKLRIDTTNTVKIRDVTGSKIAVYVHQPNVRILNVRNQEEKLPVDDGPKDFGGGPYHDIPIKLLGKSLTFLGDEDIPSNIPIKLSSKNLTFLGYKDVVNTTENSVFFTSTIYPAVVEDI